MTIVGQMNYVLCMDSTVMALSYHSQFSEAGDNSLRELDGKEEYYFWYMCACHFPTP